MNLLPQYYELDIQFINGKTCRFIATSEIVGDLYERGYKEGQNGEGTVQAISAPKPHDRDLITHDKKLMILGPGRSGTTFLVKLLTRLDFYTGYSPYNEADLGTSRAGCEFGIFSLGELRNNLNSSMTDLDEKHTQAVFQEFKEAAFIIKSPTYSWYTKLLVFHYRIPFGHILVPVRDHREVARSRIGEGLQLPIIGSSHNDQILACDVLLGKVVETAVLADIPITFTRFPDIVTNEPYCWSKMNYILSGTYDIHLDRDRFREEFYKLSDPSKIKYSPRKLKKVEV